MSYVAVDYNLIVRLNCSGLRCNGGQTEYCYYLDILVHNPVLNTMSDEVL